MKSKTLPTLFVISVVYALSVVWVRDWIFVIFTSRPFQFVEELFPRIIQTIIAFFPFGILLAFTKNKLQETQIQRMNKAIVGAWITGFACSMIIWCLYFYDGLFPKAIGANIGLGFLLLFSPVLILGIMLGSYKLLEK